MKLLSDTISLRGRHGFDGSLEVSDACRGRHWPRKKVTNVTANRGSNVIAGNFGFAAAPQALAA